MQKLLCAAAALVAFGAINTAVAADLAPVQPVYKAAVAASPPPFGWTGFYVGLNAGYGWSNNDSVSFSSNGDPFFFGQALSVGTLPTSLASTASGFIGGGQAGYNYQSGSFVYGIETDFQYANQTGAASVTAPIIGFNAPETTSAQQQLKWFGTLRPRLGFTVTPSLLVYATGGLAYGQVASTTTVVSFPGPGLGTFCGPPFESLLCGSGSGSSIRAGWTVGAGAEYGLTQHWSIKAEYLYIDLGQESYFVFSQNAPPPIGMQAAATFHESIARAGVNYRF